MNAVYRLVQIMPTAPIRLAVSRANVNSDFSHLEVNALISTNARQAAMIALRLNFALIQSEALRAVAERDMSPVKVQTIVSIGTNVLLTARVEQTRIVITRLVLTNAPAQKGTKKMGMEAA